MYACNFSIKKDMLQLMLYCKIGYMLDAVVIEIFIENVLRDFIYVQLYTVIECKCTQ